MNQPSIVRMFQALADRVRAGEPWTVVLADYGLAISESTAFVDMPTEAELAAHVAERDPSPDQNAIIQIRGLAERWGCEPSTLRDPRFRRRLGLPLIRVGGRFIGAYERDITAIEQRGRELIET